MNIIPSSILPFLASFIVPASRRAKYFRPGAVGLLSALALSSCSTAPTKSLTASAQNPPGVVDEMVEALNAQNPFSVLKRGMTAKQVEALVGRPDKIDPFANETKAKSVIWVYNRSVPVAFRQVVGGTRAVPYVDPATGEMKELMEPVMRNETVFASQRVELLMVEDLFVEWKQRAQSVRGMSN